MGGASSKNSQPGGTSDASNSGISSGSPMKSMMDSIWSGSPYINATSGLDGAIGGLQRKTRDQWNVSGMGSMLDSFIANQSKAQNSPSAQPPSPSTSIYNFMQSGMKPYPPSDTQPGRDSLSPVLNYLTFLVGSMNKGGQ